MNENFNNQNNQQGLNFNPVQGNNASMVNPLQGGNMQPNSQMNTSMQQPMENQTMAGGLNQQGVGQIHQQQVMPQQSIEQSGNMMNQQGVNGIHQQPIQPVNSMPGMPNPAPSPLPNNPQFAPNPNLMPNNNEEEWKKIYKKRFKDYEENDFSGNGADYGTGSGCLWRFCKV